MNNFKQYRRAIFYIIIILGVLMLFLTFGFTLGVLSDNPDGLERVIIDNNGRSWLEDLPSVWTPLLSWIKSDIFTGIIGILISFIFLISVFYAIMHKKSVETKLKMK